MLKWGRYSDLFGEKEYLSLANGELRQEKKLDICGCILILILIFLTMLFIFKISLMFNEK